ncbi:sulfurtransferase [Leptospira idonii]|uniref:Sulfurtransferase n=1 Tax=Leptospira idonii TaxID=1193500 RepID=A0A4V3JYS3_9LEPT|nr:rhodanese-like domain-containing protein [Leptospira idonii]TGN21116.1 sulfurtransferase [Leptospira idonii]
MNQYIRSISIFLILSAVLTHCKNPKDYNFLPALLKLKVPPAIKVNSAEELANASSEDYNENRFGLITASTLNYWLSNWNVQKPAGITGKLILFQIDSNSTANHQFIYVNPYRGVFGYLIDSGYLNGSSTIFGQTRTNGLIESEMIVPEGKVIDSFLSAYKVDPKNDLIVLVPNTSTEKDLTYTLRANYALRYWGVSNRNIAVLNGSAKQNIDESLLPSLAAKNTDLGTAEITSVSSLLTDNTILQATLGDVIHIIKNGNTNFQKVTPIPAQGVVFLDNRSSTEFTPPNQNGQTDAPSGKTCSAGSGCKTPIDGHIRNAANIPWNQLLVNTGASNYRFKTKVELTQLFSDAGISGNKHVITYSRNATNDMIAFFVSNAILGYPTRVYNGSWLEWSSLAYDEARVWTNLNFGSPWRTDQLTDSLTFTSNTNLIPRYSFTTTSAFAVSSNQAIDNDKDYIRGNAPTPVSGGASGGGGNACGG